MHIISSRVIIFFILFMFPYLSVLELFQSGAAGYESYKIQPLSPARRHSKTNTTDKVMSTYNLRLGGGFFWYPALFRQCSQIEGSERFFMRCGADRKRYIWESRLSQSVTPSPSHPGSSAAYPFPSYRMRDSRSACPHGHSGALPRQRRWSWL